MVATPSLNAKAQFLASLHDEFELLDFDANWVHVRISGLSRGWICAITSRCRRALVIRIPQARSHPPRICIGLFTRKQHNSQATGTASQQKSSDPVCAKRGRSKGREPQ